MASPPHPFDPTRRFVAYGAGGAFQNIVLQGLLPAGCDYVVDGYFEGDSFEGVPVRRPEHLSREDKATPIVLFAMSSALDHTLRDALIERGFAPNNIYGYGDVFFDGFARRAIDFGLRLERGHFDFVRTSTALLGVDNHSSSLGTTLLLALLVDTDDNDGPVAELGVYRGGNALVACLASLALGIRRRYYLIDSFEGFPELSKHDPDAAAGMFQDASLADIRATFARFPHVRIVRGIVPGVLSGLEELRFSVVYYDCDLHDPARATLEFFAPRLSAGGYVLIHDYLPKLGGFDGVRVAVDAFLADRDDFDRMEVPETTHLVLRRRGR